MARTLSASKVDVETPTGTARLHVVAVARARGLVVLGHGAGRGTDTADLLGLADVLPHDGVSVVLVDQPWVVAGRRVAVAPPVLDKAWPAAVAAAREAASASRRTPLVVGGRSAGARVACRTAVTVGAQAVLLLAFPLRPPDARRSPEREAAALAVRRAELQSPLLAGIPVVVAQGERDAFGGPQDVREALGRVAGVDATVVSVPGADHRLVVGRTAPDPAPTLLSAALRAISAARGE